MIGVVALSAIVVACAVGVGGADVACSASHQLNTSRQGLTDEPSPSELQDLITSFCEAHSSDSRLDKAFDCRTGCPLADALNQVCYQTGTPSCKETESNCTNEVVTNQIACGKSYNVSRTLLPAYLFSPCGYPRCPEACLMTYTFDDVTDGPQFSLRATVICSDTLTIYYGSARSDNILLNSTCIEEGDAENFFDVELNLEMRTITIAIDKTPGGRGFGHVVDFTGEI